MTLRKITIDNSVRYIPITEKTIKAGFLPRKQSKNISRNSKKTFKNVAAKGFAVLKRIMKCYF